jgi:ABC-type branched-subunit amino acid transport system ATPase component
VRTTTPQGSPAGAGPAGESSEQNVLEVRDLSVTYTNGARGVHSATISVPRGSIVAILGRNGAGKTSLLRGIAGFLRSERTAVRGTVTFKGIDTRGFTPVATNRMGMVFVPERDKVFPALRVREHLALVARRRLTNELRRGVFDGLERRMDSKAGLLSGGERQMLALAMAWAQEPDLLLIDELSLGLAPVIVKDLMSRLRIMTDSSGLPILVVEQDAVAALRVADHVYVMDRGEVVWNGARGTITAAELGSKYLGTGP